MCVQTAPTLVWAVRVGGRCYSSAMTINFSHEVLCEDLDQFDALSASVRTSYGTTGACVQRASTGGNGLGWLQTVLAAQASYTCYLFLCAQSKSERAASSPGVVLFGPSVRVMFIITILYRPCRPAPGLPPCPRAHVFLKPPVFCWHNTKPGGFPVVRPQKKDTL
jgi:hypothetical protein